MHMGGGGRRAQGADETPSVRTMLAQLAPIIVLFLLTLLSAVPNLFGSSTSSYPNYSFTPSPRFNEPHETNNLNVKYFVNQAEFSAHPISADLAQATTQKRQSSIFSKFERSVEMHYRDQMYMTCQRDQERQQRRKEAKMYVPSLIFLSIDKLMPVKGVHGHWDGLGCYPSYKRGEDPELRRV